MSARQAVLDMNYKDLNNNANLNLDKTTNMLTIITLAIIKAQRRKSHKLVTYKS